MCRMMKYLAIISGMFLCGVDNNCNGKDLDVNNMQIQCSVPWTFYNDACFWPRNILKLQKMLENCIWAISRKGHTKSLIACQK